MSCKNVRDSYKLYKETSINPVDSKTYIAYANDYNKFLSEKVLEGNEITLPSRFGTLCIVGKKQKITFDEEGNLKGLAPDWVKTKELWKNNSEAKEKKQMVYFNNHNTDNTRYKFFWSKRNILIQNKILYSLRMTRTNKRAVPELLRQGQEYITKFN